MESTFTIHGTRVTYDPNRFRSNYPHRLFASRWEYRVYLWAAFSFVVIVPWIVS